MPVIHRQVKIAALAIALGLGVSGLAAGLAWLIRFTQWGIPVIMVSCAIAAMWLVANLIVDDLNH